MPVNQLTGGNFQDIIGNPLSDGYLTLALNVDCLTSTMVAVSSGAEILISLDDTGNVITSPPQSVWPTDALTPIEDEDDLVYYLVSAYSSSGQLVWGPNAQQITSDPSPFDLGTWVPGLVSIG